MNESTSERPVTLRETSWNLLDEAAMQWGGKPDEILDSLVQSFLATDNGEAVSKAASLAKLRNTFGRNRG